MAGAIKFEMKLSGVKSAIRAIEDIGYTMKPADLRDMVRYAIKVAEGPAQSAAPRGTEPHMVKSKGARWPVIPPYAATQIKVKAKVFKDKTGARAMLGVRQPAFYATSFVELGTDKMDARPWLGPAFTSAAPAMLQRMKTWLQRKLKRVKKRMAK